MANYQAFQYPDYHNGYRVLVAKGAGDGIVRRGPENLAPALSYMQASGAVDPHGLAQLKGLARSNGKVGSDARARLAELGYEVPYLKSTKPTKKRTSKTTAKTGAPTTVQTSSGVRSDVVMPGSAPLRLGPGVHEPSQNARAAAMAAVPPTTYGMSSKTAATKGDVPPLKKLSATLPVNSVTPTVTSSKAPVKTSKGTRKSRTVASRPMDISPIPVPVAPTLTGASGMVPVPRAPLPVTGAPASLTRTTSPTYESRTTTQNALLASQRMMLEHDRNTQAQLGVMSLASSRPKPKTKKKKVPKSSTMSTLFATARATKTNDTAAVSQLFMPLYSAPFLGFKHRDSVTGNKIAGLIKGFGSSSKEKNVKTEVDQELDPLLRPTIEHSARPSAGPVVYPGTGPLADQNVARDTVHHPTMGYFVEQDVTPATNGSAGHHAYQTIHHGMLPATNHVAEQRADYGVGTHMNTNQVSVQPTVTPAAAVPSATGPAAPVHPIHERIPTYEQALTSVSDPHTRLARRISQLRLNRDLPDVPEMQPLQPVMPSSSSPELQDIPVVKEVRRGVRGHNQSLEPVSEYAGADPLVVPVAPTTAGVTTSVGRSDGPTHPMWTTHASSDEYNVVPPGVSSDAYKLATQFEPEAEPGVGVYWRGRPIEYSSSATPVGVPVPHAASETHNKHPMRELLHGRHIKEHDEETLLSKMKHHSEHQQDSSTPIATDTPGHFHEGPMDHLLHTSVTGEDLHKSNGHMYNTEEAMPTSDAKPTLLHTQMSGVRTPSVSQLPAQQLAPVNELAPVAVPSATNSAFSAPQEVRMGTTHSSLTQGGLAPPMPSTSVPSESMTATADAAMPVAASSGAVSSAVPSESVAAPAIPVSSASDRGTIPGTAVRTSTAPATAVPATTTSSESAVPSKAVMAAPALDVAKPVMTTSSKTAAPMASKSQQDLRSFLSRQTMPASRASAQLPYPAIPIYTLAQVPGSPAGGHEHAPKVAHVPQSSATANKEPDGQVIMLRGADSVVGQERELPSEQRTASDDKTKALLPRARSPIHALNHHAGQLLPPVRSSSYPPATMLRPTSNSEQPGQMQVQVRHSAQLPPTLPALSFQDKEFGPHAISLLPYDDMLWLPHAPSHDATPDTTNHLTSVLEQERRGSLSWSNRVPDLAPAYLHDSFPSASRVTRVISQDAPTAKPVTEFFHGSSQPQKQHHPMAVVLDEKNLAHSSPGAPVA